MKKKRSRKLALIGATGEEYFENLRNFILQKKQVWSAWSFKIRDDKLRKLKNQEKFALYFHHIKSRGGSGKVEYVGYVDDFKTSDAGIKSPYPSLTPENEKNLPECERKTWFRFTKVKRLNSYIDLKEFCNYDDQSPVKSNQLRSAFAYVFDDESIRKVIDEEPSPRLGFPIFLRRDMLRDERRIEDILVRYPEVLEKGIELIERQELKERGKPDLVFRDRNGNILVVEVKRDQATRQTADTLAGYIDDQKKKHKSNKIRGWIVCGEVDNKIKEAVERLEPKYDISIRKFDFLFALKTL